LLLAAAALAANFRLYLKDGTYHLAREYQIDEDRVRFYSVERSEWEEIPLELVDLKRTEAEIKERKAALARDAEMVSAEEQAERAERELAAQVPVEAGVYLIEEGRVKPVPQASAKAVTDKGRIALRVLVPAPVVPGRITVELDGERSANLVSSPQPEFYFRMALPERFAIVRLAVKKNARVVQTWQIIPVSEELIEEQEEIPVLHRQLESNLYKIWPAEPLKPGEYAVVEYTSGRRNIQVWDFACRPEAKRKP